MLLKKFSKKLYRPCSTESFAGFHAVDIRTEPKLRIAFAFTMLIDQKVSEKELQLIASYFIKALHDIASLQALLSWVDAYILCRKDHVLCHSRLGGSESVRCLSLVSHYMKLLPDELQAKLETFYKIEKEILLKKLRANSDQQLCRQYAMAVHTVIEQLSKSPGTYDTHNRVTQWLAGVLMGILSLIMDMYVLCKAVFHISSFTPKNKRCKQAVFLVGDDHAARYARFFRTMKATEAQRAVQKDDGEQCVHLS